MIQYLIRDAKAITETLADVIQADTGIVNTDLQYIAGTGAMRPKVGMDLCDEAYVFRSALGSGQAVSVSWPRTHALCELCRTKESCTATFMTAHPIKVQRQVVGLLCVVCASEEQRTRFLKNEKAFESLLSMTAEGIAARIRERAQGARSEAQSTVVEELLSYVDAGVLAIDGKQHILYINQAAKGALGLSAPPKGQVTLEKTGEKHMDQEGYMLKTAAGAYSVLGRVLRLQGRRYEMALIFKTTSDDAAPAGKAAPKPVKNRGVQRLLGNSQPIRERRERILSTSKSSSSALIVGEDGTERELTALAIHEESDRFAEAFTSFSCASVAHADMEKTLFGQAPDRVHKTPGAPGVLEEAERGTLFIDEVDLLPSNIQYKLMKTLLTRRVVRLGGGRQVPVSCRFIFAVSRPLDELLAGNILRRDLYFQMSVIPFQLSPLRDCGDDILYLAKYYLSTDMRLMGKPLRGYTESFEQAVASYSWPGNMWELQNALEYAANMIGEDGLADRPHLPYNPRNSVAAPPTNAHNLEDMEKDAILAAMRAVGENRQKLADYLGIGVATLYRKLKKYDL